jgi:phospholipase C
MPETSRRATLQGLAALLTTACSPSSRSPNKQGGTDQPSDTGSGEDSAGPYLDLLGLVRRQIDTVVVVMMENRSFDHAVGARSLILGDPEVDGLQAGFSNPHPDGGEVLVFPTEVDCVSDPPHSWNSSHEQWNAGANNGFVSTFYERDPEAAHEAMGYLEPEQQPTTNTLADEFVLCDAWFSSLMSSTWPNRFYLHCAQCGGIRGNDLPTSEYPSIYDSLTAAGRTWGSYYSNLPFMMLLPDRMVTDPQFAPIERFFEAAAAGSLPNVSVVEPIFGTNDDHPPAHPLAGQIFLAQVYEALRQSPQWGRCVLIITYDEHGGFFDHVSPPTAADLYATEGFDQLGFRVPTLIVGPFQKRAQVSHIPRDHTSFLAFVETLFELAPLTPRDEAADDLLDTFDEQALRDQTPRSGPQLVPIVADEAEIYADNCVTDSVFVRMPGTGQPELEAWADTNLAGHPADRRAMTPQLRRDLLDIAKKLGVWRPKA